MCDAGLVRKVERPGNFENNLDYGFNWQQRVDIAEFFQRRAFDKLHHDVFFVFFGHGVEDRHNVRVDQFAGQARFGDEQFLEQMAAFGVLQRFRVYALDRNLPFVERVLAQVDRAGGAFAQFANHRVFPNFFHQVSHGDNSFRR